MSNYEKSVLQTWLKSNNSEDHFMNLSKFMDLRQYRPLCIIWPEIQDAWTVCWASSLQGQSSCFAEFPGNDANVIQAGKPDLLHSFNKTEYTMRDFSLTRDVNEIRALLRFYPD